jgi:hypothetical protein
MPEQSYAHHAKYDVLYHRILFPLLVVILIGALYNLSQSWEDHSRLYNAALIAALAFALLLMSIPLRVFPLKAQDRAIRAEENLRHYVLTGKLLDRGLTVKQIVALRFAPDDEFPALAARAAAEGLTPDAIKRSIQNWRADHYRL